MHEPKPIDFLMVAALELLIAFKVQPLFSLIALLTGLHGFA